MNLREQLQHDLSQAREQVRRCVQSLTDAQSTVERLERLSSQLTIQQEAFLSDLLAAGVVEEGRPF